MLGKGRGMESETVKDVLRRFNENGIRYCLVGGLAVGQHAVPRQTQDVDVLVLPEDVPLVQQLLKGYQSRGTAVVLIFEIGPTRIDIIPGNLRAKRAAVLNAIAGALDELPVKIAHLRDMILLKLWVAPERPELSKQMRDEADIVELIELNLEKVTHEDIAYICEATLVMAYTAEEINNARERIQWLSDVIETLGLSDRRYQPPDGG